MTTRNPGLFSISDNKNNLIIFLLYLYTVQYAMTKCIHVGCSLPARLEPDPRADVRCAGGGEAGAGGLLQDGGTGWRGLGMDRRRYNTF